ncbi:hypothetical protein [Fusibacter sp. 3D3]|uniref:hypothetical protein n=1 Tax=Fusibacter sp. 3D3 TaxID=1048380 RepID=UPI000852FBCF|nr:hypothetical protein [Fusibacter sp. 3D3]GAU75859.1 hypothetical protein F3D3_0455 [Fusibacter sp. 3D3]
MKKTLSLLLSVIMLFTVSTSSFANSNDTSQKVIKVAVKSISQVNGLDKEQSTLLEESLTPIIKKMSVQEQENLMKEMNNLEKEYELQKNSVSKVSVKSFITESDLKLTSLSRSTIDDAFISFTYVGTVVAKQTGWMLMCNKAGLEVIETAIAGGAVGGSLAGILTYAAGFTITPFGAAVAATIGTFIAFNVFLIKLQLLYGDMAAIAI